MLIPVWKATEIASHSSGGVKLDAMVTTSLEVQGFCFNPSSLYLTATGSCLMEL